jgi:Interferon-induced transmembrane protein
LLQATLWVGYQGPLQNPPDDYMCYSIFVTLCCCWLIGIFAIARSSECRAAIAVGDHVTAEMQSREARSEAHLALILGIVINVLSGIFLGTYQVTS